MAQVGTMIVHAPGGVLTVPNGNVSNCITCKSIACDTSSFIVHYCTVTLSGDGTDIMHWVMQMINFTAKSIDK